MSARVGTESLRDLLDALDFAEHDRANEEPGGEFAAKYNREALEKIAPDLAADLLDAREEGEEARKEIANLRKGVAFLRRERIAVATVLDVPYATLLGEAVALRLARLTAELGAAREAHATLAWAVEREREALEEFDDAESEVREADASPPASLRARLELRARRDAALSAHVETRRATTALLVAAPPRAIGARS